MKKRHLLMVVLSVVLVTSCSTPKLGYFQDVQSGQTQQLTSPNYVKVQPGDKLSILVSSRNPQLAYLFNLPIVGNYDASSSGASLNSSRVANYKVDADGNIDFPILGALHISGLTRSEISALIKERLIKEDLLKDPIVTVDFLDLYFSVMGEVHRPGRFIINRDQTTLLDALSQAGDLTIYGVRNNVLVMRTENNTQKAYRVDLTNAQQLYASPVFYLKQDDIVYVEPNSKKARESTTNGNSLLQPSLWISAASLLTTIIVLITK